MNLEIIKEQIEEAHVLHVKGEIDVYTAPQLKEQLLPLVEEGHEVIINLSQVEYMDSTGLGVFIGALKISQNKDGRLKLRNATARIKRLFTITGLADVMDIKQEEVL